MLAVGAALRYQTNLQEVHLLRYRPQPGRPLAKQAVHLQQGACDGIVSAEGIDVSLTKKGNT